MSNLCPNVLQTHTKVRAWYTFRFDRFIKKNIVHFKVQSVS